MNFSFFGIFTYSDAETESCDFATYFTDITLEQPISFPDGRKLDTGYHCDEAYLNHRTGILQFVKSWRCRNCKQNPFQDDDCCSQPGHVEADVEHSIPVKDLYPIRWDEHHRSL